MFVVVTAGCHYSDREKSGPTSFTKTSFHKQQEGTQSSGKVLCFYGKLILKVFNT